MNSIREKKDQIVNFWSIDEESDREKLIEEIRNYSEIKTEAVLVQEIRDNFKQTSSSGISVIFSYHN
jgi:hypothetical protein